MHVNILMEHDPILTASFGAFDTAMTPWYFKLKGDVPLSPHLIKTLCTGVTLSYSVNNFKLLKL